MHSETDAVVGIARLLYLSAEGRTSWDPAAVADEADVDIVEAEAALQRLLKLRLLSPMPGSASGYSVTSPAAALARLVTAENQLTDNFHRSLRQQQEQIQTLIKDFPVGAASHNDAAIELLLTPGEVNSFLEAQLEKIEKQELAMHPGGVPPVELVDEMILRDIGVLESGVTIQALYSRHLLEIDHLREYLLEAAHHGVDIRLAHFLPQRMLLIDDGLAIVQRDPDDSSLGAFAIRSIEVVRSLKSFFHYHWSGAVPIQQVSTDSIPEKQALTPDELIIIRMLALGAKDESIARHLGVSPRTLSRTLAKLLEHLGVQTRFQAAVKLTQAGLIDFPHAAGSAGA
ncbi:helix-turn-helix transcriptional regulator [Streptomyces beijiangensis]|uniref:Helix-turn-helix transcriptional regulator n=1 Tax=Streptomyces beijiangensis TaxID=163361 RepID=A0A939F7E8_9ACTN|nr:helix-turn-helix transcriptional regulator [Streptomyces beijiangensis]MBO0512984.1 helix-turn-helix transcriptional regulator [Streptomyces beijiangensis]